MINVKVGPLITPHRYTCITFSVYIVPHTFIPTETTLKDVHLDRSVQWESCDSVLCGDLLNTGAQEADSQISLRNCSEDIGGRPIEM